MKKPGKTELTAVEWRVVSGWKAAGLPCENITPENVRRMIRHHAYHEAGHVAARMFTGQEAGHSSCVHHSRRGFRRPGEIGPPARPGPRRRDIEDTAREHADRRRGGGGMRERDGGLSI
jgi:hypothetical protein